MITFNATIQQFQKMGEKTGWMYIEITAAQAKKIKPDSKVSFRVKGHFDEFTIEKTALLPMGKGRFIIPFNAAMRKGTGKTSGQKIKVSLELDERKIPLSKDLLTCLKDEPIAFANFKKLPMSHQQYYSKWVEGAKTIQTKSKRITATLMGCAKNQNFSQMMRELQGKEN